MEYLSGVRAYFSRELVRYAFSFCRATGMMTGVSGKMNAEMFVSKTFRQCMRRKSIIPLKGPDGEFPGISFAFHRFVLYNIRFWQIIEMERSGKTP
jgi:hypothetical protein